MSASSVQYPDPRVQIRRNANPDYIWNEKPARDGRHTKKHNDVDQYRYPQKKNYNHSTTKGLEPKEDDRPQDVQYELNPEYDESCSNAFLT